MKRIIFTLLISITTVVTFAQNSTTDSIKTHNDSVKTKKVKVKLGFGEDVAGVSVNDRDTAYHASKAPGFSFGLTFTRFDLGLATLIDNGSFTLSPNNQFLSYRQWKPAM
ncbi:MAG: PorT family protein [Mucilaginibacter sp.]|nr:PorT family protein [Mucilaginibacter sp.]